MQEFKSEVAVKYNAVLGEGPCWDEKRKLLFWIDSVGNKVCISDLKTGATTIFDVGQNVGTLVLTEDDDVVVLGLVDGLYTLNIKTGELLLKCNPASTTARLTLPAVSGSAPCAWPITARKAMIPPASAICTR